jgi:hypothetical protein
MMWASPAAAGGKAKANTTAAAKKSFMPMPACFLNVDGENG